MYLSSLVSFVTLGRRGRNPSLDDMSGPILLQIFRGVFCQESRNFSEGTAPGVAAIFQSWMNGRFMKLYDG